jgi:integrase/recombinase XerD
METNLKKLNSQFIAECKYSSRLRDETIRGYVNTFKLFELIMKEIITTKDLTPSSLVEFFKQLDTRDRKLNNGKIQVGVKNTTIKTYWAKLNVFFKWLEKSDYIEKNPFEGKKSPRVSYDDFKRLTDEEVRKIITSIVQGGNKPFAYCRDMFMVNLFLLTGMRRTEFISLKLTDLDLYRRTVTIRGETSKSKFSRTLQMNSALFLMLNNYLKERKRMGYKTDNLIVSTTKDRGLTIDGLNHWNKRVVKASGVKFHPHMFRHTFACKLVEANVSIYKIKELMGHTDIRMTVKYLRSLNTADMGEDLEKISFS